MQRRQFVRGAGLAAAAATVASPAVAQSMPEIKWRLTSSFPKSLDTLYGVSEVFVKRVAEITDNRFVIQPFAAGEVVPGLQALDAVIDAITKTVAGGDKVTIAGFGTFEPRERSARTGRNPQTGEEIQIAATTVPGFKAGAAFKQAVAGS